MTSSTRCAEPGSPTSTTPPWRGRCTRATPGSTGSRPSWSSVHGDTDELAATLAVARETGTPITMRGAGTSIAGNAVGAGIVIDTSRHLNRVLELNREQRTARVQPGVVHAALQRQAVPLGLRFGPDPSTHTRCTIGGMVGNNACGSRALGYGRTVDNVEALTVLLADGSVVSTGEPRRTRRPGRRAPRHRPHRVRPLRPPGVGLLLRAPAAGERAPLRPLPGRHRGHARAGAGRDRPAGRGRPGPGAGGAGLPDDGRCGRRRTRPAGARPGRLRGARPAHRRDGAGPPGAARRRRLAVRGGHRRDRGGGRVEGEGRRRHRGRGAPDRHRHRRAARAVADPRGRRRSRGAVAQPPGAGRLGGRGGAAREARRLPPRLRRAAQGPRPRRRSLRPLRRRLRARAHRLRARGRRRSGPVPAVHRGRRRPGGVVRRLDVGRARRRPGPLGAAAEDVLTRRRSR